MQGDGLEWGEDYRPLARQALVWIIEGRMAEAVEHSLESLGVDDVADRRNGHYRHDLLTELGDIELAVPRTRRYCPVEVVRAYARRAPEIDRVIMAGFVLGLSTRKLGEVLLGLLGRPGSATTVSRVAKTLDTAVAAFRRRPLNGHNKALILDGVVLSGKTGAGALKRRCWWRWAGRRSSTSTSPGPRAPPNGRPSSPPSSAAASPAPAPR
jgi:transposase-like protein